jgi:hypothetical protein
LIVVARDGLQRIDEEFALNVRIDVSVHRVRGANTTTTGEAAALIARVLSNSLTITKTLRRAGRGVLS